MPTDDAPESAVGPPYFRYWGKARPTAAASAAMHLLPYHCLDVAAVGVEYLRPACQAVVARRMPGAGRHPQPTRPDARRENHA